SRNLHAHGDVQVAGASISELGRPLTTQPEHLPCRRGGRDHDRGLAGRRGNTDARPLEDLPHADGDLAVYAVTFALEMRMLAHPRTDDEIAARSPERPRAAFALHANLRARIDARRDVDGDGSGHPPHAAATAVGARPRARHPRAPASRARREPRYLERKSRATHDLY